MVLVFGDRTHLRHVGGYAPQDDQSRRVAGHALRPQIAADPSLRRRKPATVMSSRRKIITSMTRYATACTTLAIILTTITSCTATEPAVPTPVQPPAASTVVAPIPAQLQSVYQQSGIICAVGWSSRTSIPACALGWQVLPHAAISNTAESSTVRTPIPARLSDRYELTTRVCERRWHPSSVPVCVLSWAALVNGRFGPQPPSIAHHG